MQFSDYSHLTPAEARDKLAYLALKMYVDQHNVNFFIKSPLPEQWLKNELTAFWEGRVQEFHGWEDPLGQTAQWIVDQLEDALTDLWDDTISPALDDLISPISDTISVIKDAVSGLSDFMDAVTDFMGSISDTVAAAVVDPISVVQDWITDAISTVPDLLKDPLTTINSSIKDMWDDVTEAVSGTLEVITKGFEALPAAITSGFQDALSYLGDVFNSVWQNTLVPFGKEIQDAFTQALDAAGEMLTGMITAMIDMAKAYAPISPSRAQDYAVNVSKIVLSAGVGLGGAFLLGELLHPLKQIGLGHVAAMLYKATGYDQFTGAIVSTLVSATLRTPLKYTFNEIFRPWLPDVGTIQKFRQRGLIDDKELSRLLAYQGLADEWHPFFAELSKTIPSVRDLIEFVVKEAFPLEKLPPAPAEFLEALKMWNMDPKWGNAYWWSHWQMPAFEQLVEAYFRGIINQDELRKYIIWWDYSPDPRPGISKSDVDIMNELIYSLPDKLSARWMLRWGIITREEHQKLIAATGLHPEWVKKVSDAEFMNNLTDERSALKTAIAMLYAAGYYSEDQVKQILQQYNYLKEEVELLLKSNEYRRIKEEYDDMIAAYSTAFRYGKIDLDTFKAKLADMGIQDWRLQRIVEYEEARAKSQVAQTKTDEVRAYGYHIAMNRYEQGISSDTDLENELKMLGYSESQIERYKTAAKLERDRLYALEVLSAAKTAWQKGYIGDDTFIKTLQDFGFEDWKIQLELNLMKLKRGLFAAEKEGAE